MSIKNLKLFNLQEALNGKAVMLRCDQKAYVRHYETELTVSESGRLIGFSGDGTFLSWCANGQYLTSAMQHSHDIVGMYPETRFINGFEVPKPESEKPNHYTTYYYPVMHAGNYFAVAEWYDDETWHERNLERGLIFLCKEDAVATTKAMLGIDPNV